ncbi:MAG: sugar ABC transporter ATP-binding protein [Propionibacteriaceae bacterium]|nr:sugar ABC transporter ATP-binding protein [Propionibacteriaceae bacterium]
MSLAMRNVRKSYGNAEVLHGVSLTAEPGQVVGIVGANGAGKSTLIKVLAGAITMDSGEIELDGKPLNLKSPRDAITLGIHTVYQELSIVPELTVTENLLMGSLPKHRGLISWRRAHKKAAELLEETGFGVVNHRLKTGSLTVARQQMVEIAKALVTQPRILVLDEPSAVLSGSDLDSLYSLIARLKKTGTTVIYISHRLQEVLNLADTIIVMKDGEFLAEMTPAQTDEDHIIALMAGRKIDQVYPDRRDCFGEPALELINVSRPGEFEDISFTLHRGEVLSIFGLVGSGRSELVEALFGARRFASGEVLLNGKKRRFTKPSQAVEAGMALVTEDRKRTGLILGLKVSENITLATWHGLILNKAKQRSDIAAMTENLSIQPANSAGLEAWQLSGGNQQKVVLAKWLLTDPQILVLDEPTRGVDMTTRVQIYSMIDDLARRGLSVLMVSSDLTEAIEAADRVLVMREGRLVSEFTAAQTTEDEVLASSIGVKYDQLHDA